MGPICLDLCASLGTLTPSGQVLHNLRVWGGPGRSRAAEVKLAVSCSPLPSQKTFSCRVPGILMQWGVQGAADGGSNNNPQCPCHPRAPGRWCLPFQKQERTRPFPAAGQGAVGQFGFRSLHPSWSARPLPPPP